MKVANTSGGGGQKKTTPGLASTMNQMNQPLRNNTKEKIKQRAKTAAAGGGGQKKTTPGLAATMNQMNQPLRNNTKEKLMQGVQTAKRMMAKDNTNGLGQARAAKTTGLQKSAGGVKSADARATAKPMRGQAGPTPQTTRPTPQTTRPTPQAQQKTQQVRADMVDQLLSKQYSVREAARRPATVKTPKRR